MVARPCGYPWQQLAFYSLVSGNALAADPPKPSFAGVFSSRRLRLLVPVTVTFLILVFFGRRYDAPPGIRADWRNDSNNQDPAPSTVKSVDWSGFAYIQYVTDSHYLCNSVMLFERLQHVGSRADRVLLYPSYMLNEANALNSGTSDDDARLLVKARDEYKARLVPIEVQRQEPEGDDKTWAESFTKLLAFNQTQYDRVLSLDSDAVVLQNMDELFLLPPCPIAVPRAYWLYPERKILASHIMLLQPSEAEFARVTDKIREMPRNEYDMEVVNYLYQDSALVLPHRPYALLTAEFRYDPDKHATYLGTDREEWDPVAVFNEAKYLHFSDWPVSKPWLDTPAKKILENQPKCHLRHGVESCLERDMWNGFYSEFKERRKCVEPFVGNYPGRGGAGDTGAPAAPAYS